MATRLRSFYLSYIHCPNNPVDRAARWIAERLSAAVQKVMRGSLNRVRIVLAFILATVATVGTTLLAGFVGWALTDKYWVQLLTILVTAVISEVTLVRWFSSAHTVGEVIERFRVAIQAEFLALGIIVAFLIASVFV